MKTLVMITLILVSLLLAYSSGAGRSTGIALSLVSQPSASDSLRANFTYSPQIPVVNQPVFFVDNSSGNINYWEWNFGDGATVKTSVASEANQTHTYAFSGIFSVQLHVADVLNDTSDAYSLVSVRRINTSLSLDVPESTGNGNEVVLRATLTDEDGNRVSAMDVSFYVNDSRGDNVLVGSDFTDPVGRVSVSFVSSGAGSVVAVFNGTLVYSGAVSNVQPFSLGVNFVPYAVLLSAAVLVMSIIIAYLRRSRRQAAEEEETPEPEEEEEED